VNERRPAGRLFSDLSIQFDFLMKNLVAPGLCIRPFQMKDAPAFAAAARTSLETVGKWLPWCHAEYSLLEAEQWMEACARNLAAGTAFSMGIFAEDESALLGGIGINQINREHHFGQIGYWISQPHQGRQIAPRAVRMMAEFGFSVLDLTRLEILVPVGNEPSRRVAEKSGATLDGILKNRLVIRGQCYAAAMYSLTPDRSCALKPRPA
jgi:RimJ/RimL family protein N-acetyltransferase